jgi:hypothetical protein
VRILLWAIRCQRAVRPPDQFTGRLTLGEGHQQAAICFRQPWWPTATRAIAQSFYPLCIEAYEPFPHGLRMAPERCGNGRRTLSGPTALNHPRPQNPIPRGVPAPAQLPHLPLFPRILGRASKK